MLDDLTNISACVFEHAGEGMQEYTMEILAGSSFFFKRRQKILHPLVKQSFDKKKKKHYQHDYMRDYYSPDITPRGDPNFGSELDILN
jgi:hypothetical protein